MGKFSVKSDRCALPNLRDWLNSAQPWSLRRPLWRCWKTKEEAATRTRTESSCPLSIRNSSLLNGRIEGTQHFSGSCCAQQCDCFLVISKGFSSSTKKKKIKKKDSVSFGVRQEHPSIFKSDRFSHPIHAVLAFLFTSL